MKKRILYKFRSLATESKRLHVRDIITKRELYFSDPINFNDPYDCQIAEYLNRYLRPYYVLCFSTDSCDMILMFSHYADCHRGLCLQFEIDEDDILSNIKPLIGREVKYCNTMPHLPDDPNRAHESYLIKYVNWDYESEYRVLWAISDLPPSRLVNYRSGQLRGAIFGLRMTNEHESKIRQWFEEAGHQNIFFKKARLSENDFGLIFVNV